LCRLYLCERVAQCSYRIARSYRRRLLLLLLLLLLL
jgi:hypothetical protein